MRPWDVLPSSPASALSVLFPTPLSLLFLSYGESDERQAKPPPTSNPSPSASASSASSSSILYCLPACSLETNLTRAELTKRKKLLLSLSLSLSGLLPISRSFLLSSTFTSIWLHFFNRISIKVPQDVAFGFLQRCLGLASLLNPDRQPWILQQPLPMSPLG